MSETFLKRLAARIAHIGRWRGLRTDVPALPDVPDPSRREFIRAGVGVVGGLAVAAVAPRLAVAAPLIPSAGHGGQHGSGHSGNIAVGEVDTKRMAYDPVPFLTQFDRGKVSRLPGGRMLREFKVVVHDREIEIAPGVFFPAWTFNGTVPGTTLRVREGDRVRIQFVNAGTHPHTMHFHGIHRSEEHTSELQSLRHLVCRLLLEKKKNNAEHDPRRLQTHNYEQKQNDRSANLWGNPQRPVELQASALSQRHLQNDRPPRASISK